MFTDQERDLISKAKAVLLSKINTNSVFTNPQTVKDFCQLSLAPSEQEVFAVMYLDNQHRLIKFEKMFFGTVSSCSVHPREVAKMALFCNAAAVIFTHNHPSGVENESRSDREITETLKTALKLFDIRVLDHIVVTNSGCLSFADKGLL